MKQGETLVKHSSAECGVRISEWLVDRGRRPRNTRNTRTGAGFWTELLMIEPPLPDPLPRRRRRGRRITARWVRMWNGKHGRNGTHGSVGKKFLMRFYAVRCGQRRRFGNLGRAKTGQATALEREKTASGRVNTAYESRWVREVAGGESMAERSVLPDCAAGAGRKIQLGGVHQTTSFSVGGFKSEPAGAGFSSVVKKDGIEAGNCQDPFYHKERPLLPRTRNSARQARTKGKERSHRRSHERRPGRRLAPREDLESSWWELWQKNSWGW